MTRAEFIAQTAPYAVEDMLESGVLASITIAQAILESNSGNSAPGNNLFGIKGSGTTQTTQEFINGSWITIQAGFRAYDSWLGSICDHSAFLTENSRYAHAGFFERCAARDYAGAARALQSAGYATDPSYAALLIGLIESNGLRKYDEEADKMLLQISALQDEIQTLLKTAEAHVERINALEEKAGMPAPYWAESAVESAVTSGLIDTPNGGSYDFYRLLTVLHRKGIV